jgi:protein-disulfide isomerase
MTALVARQQFFGGRDMRRPGPSSPATPVKVANWQQYAIGGHRIGPSDAPVTVVEFADFECPFCRAFEVGALQAARTQFPNQIAVVFREWPLTGHKFAYPTARAAECAAAQGRFAAFHDLVYEEQDSLGFKRNVDFARDAGVANLDAFSKCTSDTAPVPEIEADRSAALKLGAGGTPAIIVDGLLLPGNPDTAAFIGYVRDALNRAGKR